MPDRIFADPQLADIYDLRDDPERPDLTPYLAMADEFQTHNIIDLGCGTGMLACRLAAQGKAVIGIDPAAASLAVAQRKMYAERVRWIRGTAAQMPESAADLITMTGNVAQVFVTDEEWQATLRACRAALHSDGRLVFEVRDPAQEAWKHWNRAETYQVTDIPGIGSIEKWEEVVQVPPPLVTFQTMFVFPNMGSTLMSDSTLRFRSQQEIKDTLAQAHFTMESVRDAPDRPGKEFVFVVQ